MSERADLQGGDAATTAADPDDVQVVAVTDPAMASVGRKFTEAGEAGDQASDDADSDPESLPSTGTTPAALASDIDDSEVEERDAPSVTAALEALLIIADEPISTIDLATAINQPVDTTRTLLESLAAEYHDQQRGFELRASADRWRFYSAIDCAGVVTTFITDGQSARLSQAALETLAVIAYRQPVTRSHIAGIRGVNVDGVVRTLTARGLVAPVGVDPNTGAGLYGTTEYFLERMGLAGLEDLPPLAEHVPIGSELDEIIESHQR